MKLSSLRVSPRKKPVTRAIRLVAWAAVLGVMLWGGWVEPSRLVLRETTLVLPAWSPQNDGLSVALVSDLHVGSPFVDLAKVRTVVTKVNGLAPDLVLLAGDFMAGHEMGATRVDPELIAEALRPLHGRLGVFAVLGNHDHWFDGKRVQKALEDSGIVVLENQSLKIDAPRGAFWLVGLADFATRPQAIRATLARAGRPALVLTHEPDSFAAIPENVALTLAGHTHGGQVALPILGPLDCPSNYGCRYAEGHIQEQNRHLYVTSGVGTSIFPVRFRVPPEIVLLKLRAERR